MGDPIIVKQRVLPKNSFGGHDRIVISQVQYDSTTLPEWVEYELWVSDRATELLDKAYPGHSWDVICRVSKGNDGILRGAVYIGLPVLMGSEWVYIINLRDLEPMRVIAAGGTLLERYRLPRGKFELGSFLEARAKHSILLDRTKKVPE